MLITLLNFVRLWWNDESRIYLKNAFADETNFYLNEQTELFIFYSFDKSFLSDQRLLKIQFWIHFVLKIFGHNSCSSHTLHESKKPSHSRWLNIVSNMIVRHHIIQQIHKTFFLSIIRLYIILFGALFVNMFFHMMK